MKKLPPAIFALALATSCQAATVDSDPAYFGDWILFQPVAEKVGKPEPFVDRPATISLSADRYSGFDGCNYVNGHVRSSSEGKIAFPQPGVSTLMGCTGDNEAISRQFGQALAGAQSYRVSGNQLVLLDGNATLLATFVRQPSNIASTSWRQASYHDGRSGFVSTLISEKMTLSFLQSGQVKGFGGCQDYQGVFQSEEANGKVGFSNLVVAASRQRCSAASRREQQRYLKALARAVRYKRIGNAIEFYDGNGMRVVSFKAQ
jgi:heat shock protein HslJ